MNNENKNVQTESDARCSSASTLLAYVERAVIAEMFKPVSDAKTAGRSDKS